MTQEYWGVSFAGRLLTVFYLATGMVITFYVFPLAYIAWWYFNRKGVWFWMLLMTVSAFVFQLYAYYDFPSVEWIGIKGNLFFAWGGFITYGFLMTRIFSTIGIINKRRGMHFTLFIVSLVHSLVPVVKLYVLIQLPSQHREFLLCVMMVTAIAWIFVTMLLFVKHPDDILILRLLRLPERNRTRD